MFKKKKKEYLEVGSLLPSPVQRPPSASPLPRSPFPQCPIPSGHSQGGKAQEAESICEPGRRAGAGRACTCSRRLFCGQLNKLQQNSILLVFAHSSLGLQ